MLRMRMRMMTMTLSMTMTTMTATIDDDDGDDDDDDDGNAHSRNSLPTPPKGPRGNQREPKISKSIVSTTATHFRSAWVPIAVSIVVDVLRVTPTKYWPHISYTNNIEPI